MTRHEFMAAYRAMPTSEGADLNAGLTADDRHEIFSGIMLGASDFSVGLFNDILADYGVEWTVQQVVAATATDAATPMTAQAAKAKTCEYLNGAGNGGGDLQDVLDAVDAHTGMGKFEMRYWFVATPTRQTCKQLVELGYSVLCNWDHLWLAWGKHTTPREWRSHDDAEYDRYYIK
jgi:hypothetical protein